MTCFGGFGKTEEPPTAPLLSSEEMTVVRHFDTHHHQNAEGRFVVSLPKKQNVKSIGESRSQAVRRFLAFERTLSARNRHKSLTQSCKSTLISSMQNQFHKKTYQQTCNRGILYASTCGLQDF